MPTVALLHGASADPASLAGALRRAGHDAEPRALRGLETLRALADDPPDALLVDLRAAPASLRDAALWLRARKATRALPLVLVGADAETAALVPGAIPATARGAAAALRRALGATPATPRPASVLAGYSGTPLPRKLGVTPGARVVLLGAPEGFPALLPDAELRTRGEGDVVLAFARSRAELARRLAAGARAMREGGRLWLAWPKKASGVATDVAEPIVREAGLAAGLVDYKVCAIDATWSGLCFARRRPRPGPAAGRDP